MPIPSDLKTFLDNAYDDAAAKATGNKKSAQRATWNGAQLTAMFNLDASAKTQELLIVRIRVPAS